ncbi:phosphotransferase [Streptomyces sp. NPDC006207]
MPPRTLSGDQAGIEAALVRRLLHARFPHWADLPLTPTGSAGTSNVMYRLDSDTVVRLPRTAGTANDVDEEHEWLPRLAPRLPAPVPAPPARALPSPATPLRAEVDAAAAGAVWGAAHPTRGLRSAPRHRRFPHGARHVQ